jgi:hypothetical protein
MKKIIKLTESDLTRIVKQIINEDIYDDVDDYAMELQISVSDQIAEILYNVLQRIDFGNIISEHQELLKNKYPNYEELESSEASYLMSLSDEGLDIDNLSSYLADRITDKLGETKG